MKNEVSSYQTKCRLADALKDLMRKKSLSKITVSDLVNYCDINRKTFYYHFENIQALLSWIIENDAIRIVNGYNLIEDKEEVVDFIIRYIHDNDHLLNCIFEYVGPEELRRFLNNDFEHVVSTLIRLVEKEFSRYLEPDYREFIVDFYTEALSGKISSYVRHRGTTDPQKIKEYVFKTLQSSLIAIINAEGKTKAGPS